MQLSVKDIDVFYGGRQALFGMRLAVSRGAAVALLGRNGMGKTTTVRAITGQLRCRRGEIIFGGEKIHGLPPQRIAQKGLGLAPEGRQIFPNLNARENLVAAAANYNGAKSPWNLERVLELFPQLKPRLNNMGSQLSGGEQQMLSIGRALMLNPHLLVLDEATEGLAPLVQKTIWEKLREIKQTGISLLLIDKNLGALCELADRLCIMEKGALVWEGGGDALRADRELQARYLGV
ncbi:MAG: ABC transporter ATP-binding protein [Gammaproteobacteria bacterium]|nr:ABC transporter ATP-binding protein [Gammaproteobacteria bacterium]